MNRKQIQCPKTYTHLYFVYIYYKDLGFPGSSAGKESTCNAEDPSSIPGSGRSLGEGIGYSLQLEKEMATHSSILTWVTPWTEEPGGLQSMGSQSRTGLKWQSSHTCTHALTPMFMGLPGGSDSKEPTDNAGDLSSIPGLGRSSGGDHGNPLRYFCVENPHGQRSLVGYNPRLQRVGHNWATKRTHKVLLYVLKS